MVQVKCARCKKVYEFNAVQEHVCLEFGFSRKKEKQTRLVPVSRRVLSEEEKKFNEEKRRLHSVYKSYKVGLLTWDMISEKDKRLLVKYYGL